MSHIFFDEATEFTSKIANDATISNATFMCAVVGLVAILAVMIIAMAYNIKKHGGSVYGVLLGVGVYLVFFYAAGMQLANLILYLMPKSVRNHDIVKVLVASFMTALIPILGRLLTMKLFPVKMKEIKVATNFGTGLALMEGAVAIIGFFGYIIFYKSVNANGFGYFVSNATSQDALDTYEKMFATTAGEHVSSMLYGAAMVFMHLAMSLPLLAGFLNKTGKYEYFICFGVYFIMEFLAYGNSYSFVPAALKAVVAVIIVLAFIIYALRIYNFHFKKDEDDAKEEKKKAETKKMPRFNNLSNL